VILSGGVIGPLLLLLGLAATEAAAASLLLNLESLFTLVIAWVVFGESVDRRIGAGAIAILLGAALLSWNGSVGLGISWGALAIAGACLARAIDNNLTRKLSGADPVAIAMAKGLAAGPVNLLIATGLGASWPGLGALATAGAGGLLGYGVSLALFILALRYVGAARTGAYFSLAPFMGALIALALLGEKLTLQLVAAALLMGVGVWLHLTERHEHEHIHEPLIHEHRHVHDEHHRHVHGPADPLGEPHSHVHTHTRLIHGHPHYPDIHHRHTH
jgi:drug/metabolite transporter (DMT)-like permease